MSLFRKNKYPRHLLDESNLSFSQQALIFFWETFKVVVISLAIIIPVRYFLIKPFYVKGASMEPNFYDHEYLIVDEISYRFGEPQRGDIVVFKYPLDPRQYFIKRVIGLPNEKIKIGDGKITITNQADPAGAVLQENYLPADLATNGDIEITLKSNEYYLLGDNRLSSLDSRIFGPVNREYIVGKVFWRGWPIDRIKFFNQTLDYNLK